MLLKLASLVWHAGAILSVLINWLDFKTTYIRSWWLRVRAASNDLRIETEHVELSRKGPYMQSQIIGIPVTLIFTACVCFKRGRQS